MKFKNRTITLLALILLAISLLGVFKSPFILTGKQAKKVPNTTSLPNSLSIADVNKLNNLLTGAKNQIGITKTYDPAYSPIPYPNGDVPLTKGVCSDVIVRAFRAAGIDLQQAVHEDMVKNFRTYPEKWGLTTPDANIDHRRVPNLQTYFTRKGKALKITYLRTDYQPGDIVTWDLNGYGLAHIGLVSDIWSETHQRFLIIHNIGQGAQLEDRLFDWRITGHYRYF